MKNVALDQKLLERLAHQAEQNDQTPSEYLEALLDRQEQPPHPTSIFSPEIFELMPDGIVITDEFQRIVAFNAGAAQIFGHSPDEMLGQPLVTLMPDDLSQIHHQHVQSFMDSPETSRHMAARQRVHGKRKDGTTFPLEASILTYTRAGQVYNVAIVRDVTKHEATLEQQRKRKALLELLTENATDLICLHEPDGTYVYVSPAIRKIGGYEPEDLIGKNPYDFFHPEDIPSIQEHHESSAGGNEMPTVVYRHRCKDGHYVWMETLTNAVYDADGNIVNLVTISRDITERRAFQDQLQAERDLLSRIMETSPSGITVVDADGQIIFANRRAEQIHGTDDHDRSTDRTYDAPVWKHTDYDGNPWPDEKQPFVRVMKTKAPVWEVRHAIEWTNGRKVYLSINGAPILDDDGEVSKVVFTVEDYTQRKHQQDELEAALERERKLNAMKSTFLSMVSHEFRTPMAVITSSTGLVRMVADRISPDDLRYRMHKIEEQIDRLNRLINDVTFINKADLLEQEPMLEVVDMDTFLRQVIGDVNTAYAYHRPIQLVQESVCKPLMLDPLLMQKIVGNLLSNAMKYSPNDSPVKCSYMCDQDTLTLLVSDNGMGIPEADQRQLFEVFHRAQNVGKISGTGLGLAIVKRAVDALDGTITFESEEGSGTRFLVNLPVQCAVDEDEPAFMT